MKIFCSGIADECADGIVDQIKMHKLLGWDYIELRNIDGKTIDTLDDDLLAKIKQELTKANMRVSCLASDIGKLSLDGKDYRPFTDDLESLPTLLKRANELNCKYIRVMAYKQENLSDEQWRDQAVARLKELAKMAADAHVYLALENCVGWHSYSGERMVELLERVDEKYLVALYDTGNTYHEGIDPWEFYLTVKDKIGYVHIKDRLSEGKGFTFPGEGSSQVKPILQDLSETGYSGFVSIEPHMAGSAHLKHLQGDSWNIYYEYGTKLNQLSQQLS